jgi:hypothetical protein
MDALSRISRSEIQGDAIDTVRAMIQQGCKVISSSDTASCWKPADVKVFLRAVQRMLYQEAFTMEETTRRESVEFLLTLLTSTHKTVQQIGQTTASSAAVDDGDLERLQLLLELSRTVGCLLYEVPTVSGEILKALVMALRPLLEFPRDMPTSSSAVVAATLMQKEQQQQQQQPQPLLLHARHTRVLISACSSDALANASAGLGRAADTFATDMIPQLTINLLAWSALVTASLSLEGLATCNSGDVDVYMEALTSTLRALHIILAEAASSSALATSVVQTLSERTFSELRGGRLLAALAECLVSILLWVPSTSAIVAAKAVGQLQGISDSDLSSRGGERQAARRRGPQSKWSSGGVGGAGVSRCGRGGGAGVGISCGQGVDQSGADSTDGVSTDDMSGGGATDRRDGFGGVGGRGYGGSLGKIRLHSVMALQSLARLLPKVFHPFWAQLLPGDMPQNRRAGQSITLLSILVSDPSPKVRTAAAQALHALFQVA